MTSATYKSDSVDAGGPAFPHASGPMIYIDAENKELVQKALAQLGEKHGGMTIRDYFAIHAPEPSPDDITLQSNLDRSRNPHNEAHKPKIRESREIVADLRYRFADAMIAARSKP